MSVDFALRIALFWIAVLLCIVAEFFILRSMMRASRGAAVTPVDASDVVIPRSPPAVEMVWAILPALGLILVLVLTRAAIR